MRKDPSVYFPLWVVVSQGEDRQIMWGEAHKEMAHQLGEIQKMEKRLNEMESRMGILSIAEDGLEGRVNVLEQGSNRVMRLVLKITRTLAGQSTQLDLSWQFLTAFLLPGRLRTGGGTGPADGGPIPEGGSGQGSPASSCPSLVSLGSSWLGSPTLNTPSDEGGAHSFPTFLQESGHQGGSTSSSLQGRASSEDGDIGVLGVGGLGGDR